MLYTVRREYASKDGEVNVYHATIRADNEDDALSISKSEFVKWRWIDKYDWSNHAFDHYRVLGEAQPWETE